MDEPTNGNLEEAILGRLGDPEPYLVYADWLQEREVPRGRLIVTQVALDDHRTPELEAAERALLAHRALRVPTNEHGSIAAEWRFGFWRTLDIEQVQGASVDLVPLLAHPSARFLRGLELDELVSLANTGSALHELRRTLVRFMKRGPLVADDAALSVLQLDRLGVTHVDTKALLQLPGLHVRTFAIQHSGPDLVSAIGLHPTIARLDLGFIHGLGARQARSIGSIPNLVTLRLRTLHSDRDGFWPALPEHTQLQELVVGSNDVDDEAAGHIARCSQLNRLVIESQRITRSAIEMLAGLPRLRFLEVLGRTFDLEADPEALARALRDAHFGARR